VREPNEFNNDSMVATCSRVLMPLTCKLLERNLKMKLDITDQRYRDAADGWLELVQAKTA